MTWWTATSVSINNGQSIVNVNAGDDVQIAQEAGGLVIGNQPPVEIKRTFRDGSNQPKIELRHPWPYSNQTNQPAVAFPTDADLAEATRILREVASDFDMQPTASSVAVRTADGRLKATNATESNDVVVLGQGDARYVGKTGNQNIFGSLVLASETSGAGLSTSIDFPAGIYNKSRISGRSTSNFDAGELAFFTAPDGDLIQERMTIKSNGNVGIGTTNPTSPLTVNSSQNYPLSLNTNAISNTFTGISLGALGFSPAASSGSATIVCKHHHEQTADSSLAFSTFSSAGLTEKMTIGPTGKLNITTQTVNNPTNISSVGGVQINGQAAGESQVGITYQDGGGGGAAILMGRGNSFDTNIRFCTNMQLNAVNGAITERMRIDGEGKLLSPNGSAFVGTVSNAGLGAIIQRGSNANGEFVRFADGTQICTAIFSTDHGTRVTTTSINWVFPVSFDVGQSITSGSFWCIDTGIDFRNGVLTQSNNSPGSTAAQFAGFDFNKQPFSNSLFVLTAIGRWF